MKMLKLLTGLSGPAYCLAPGDEHAFENDEAERLIAAGAAEEAEPEKPAAKKAAKKG